MPFKSKAQQSYFNANRDRLEGQGVDVDEWNDATKGMKLPKRASKPVSKKPSRSGWASLSKLGES